MEKVRIIEFLGMPNMGLSAYAAKAKKEIEKNQGIKVKIFEGAKRKTIADKLMGLPGFSIKSAEKTITRIMDHDEGILLLSRGLWDNAAFLLAARQAGAITPKQYQESIKYFDAFEHFTKAAVMICSPVCDSLENYHENCYCSETPQIYSKINNPRFLKYLAKAYIITYFGMTNNINPEEAPSIDPNNVLILNGNGKLNANMKHISKFMKRVLEPGKEKKKYDSARI